MHSVFKFNLAQTFRCGLLTMTEFHLSAVLLKQVADLCEPQFHLQTGTLMECGTLESNETHVGSPAQSQEHARVAVHTVHVKYCSNCLDCFSQSLCQPSGVLRLKDLQFPGAVARPPCPTLAMQITWASLPSSIFSKLAASAALWILPFSHPALSGAGLPSPPVPLGSSPILVSFTLMPLQSSSFQAFLSQDLWWKPVCSLEPL